MASCDNCKKGAVLPGEPTGTMVNGAYLAAGPEGNTSRAIILLTDIFGLPLINCKIIADNISKRLQCDVWVPDLFNGPFRTMNLLFWPHQYTRQTSYHGRQAQSSRASRRENKMVFSHHKHAAFRPSNVVQPSHRGLPEGGKCE